MPRICALLVLLALACATQAPVVDVAKEEEAIRQLTKAWFADEIRRDMEASLSYLAPDAVVQGEGTATITSSSGMRALYEELFNIPYTDVVMDPRTVVVSSSGDLAYDVGTWKMIISGPQGVTEAPGKSTIIWRKSEDRWKAVVMAFSMDQPAVPTSN